MNIKDQLKEMQIQNAKDLEELKHKQQMEQQKRQHELMLKKEKEAQIVRENWDTVEKKIDYQLLTLSHIDKNGWFFLSSSFEFFVEDVCHKITVDDIKKYCKKNELHLKYCYCTYDEPRYVTLKFFRGDVFSSFLFGKCYLTHYLIKA